MIQRAIRAFAGSVGVDAALTTMPAGYPNCRAFLIKNTHASATLYLGDASDVTTATGYPIAAQDQLYVECQLDQRNGIWLIASGASTTFRVLALG